MIVRSGARSRNRIRATASGSCTTLSRCMDWQEHYANKRTTADEAVLRIRPASTIFIGSGAAEPVGLVEALGRHAEHFCRQHDRAPDDARPGALRRARVPGALPPQRLLHRRNVRRAVHEGRADYTPVFLSQIPALIRTRRMPVEVALIQCAPPDKFGFVNLGVSVDIVLAALDAARTGDRRGQSARAAGPRRRASCTMDRIDLWVAERRRRSSSTARSRRTRVELEIGRNVAGLVEDGSTLQTGIGQDPRRGAAGAGGQARPRGAGPRCSPTA